MAAAARTTMTPPATHQVALGVSLWLNIAACRNIHSLGEGILAGLLSARARCSAGQRLCQASAPRASRLLRKALQRTASSSRCCSSAEKSRPGLPESARRRLASSKAEGSLLGGPLFMKSSASASATSGTLVGSAPQARLSSWRSNRPSPFDFPSLPSGAGVSDSSMSSRKLVANSTSLHPCASAGSRSSKLPAGTCPVARRPRPFPGTLATLQGP
mmetsp:Transcript_60591/g.131338  ORF Transcript_60591/g.131338 Transcript_60591/m.131338 type:complete len:216 (-) Transcript_60591:135-782(-)